MLAQVDFTQFVDLKVIILAVFALAEAVVRVTPTEKDNSIVNKVVAVGSYLLDLVLPNRSKKGGFFGLKREEKDTK